MITLKSGNILHDDGRIFFEGDGISFTVSPYANDFFDNIEEEIQDLVRLLIKKGYLTYSSCAGHQAVKRRFVSVAFPSEERAQQFINDITERYEHSLLSFSIKHPTHYYGVNWGNIHFNTSYLNKIFYRYYSDYSFVELSIGKNTEPSFSNVFKILRKFFFRDYVTHRLVAKLKDLPEYDM